MEELVSVIVPVYKVERYLNKCITSIVQQTYKNLDIILVNDGSPDNCSKLCDMWAQMDSRIRVLHKQNGGLSDARNAGIEISQGEFIVFVDSDDYIRPQMIEQLMNSIKIHNTKISICNILCVNSEGDDTGESNDSPIVDEILRAEEVLRRFYQSHGWFYIVAWNKMYHRSLLNDNFFPYGKWHEDEFVAAQLIWKAEKISCTSYKGYIYVRQRKDSITEIRNDVRHLDALEALIERYRFYQEIGAEELLLETRERVFKSLEKFYCEEDYKSVAYKQKMKLIRKQYGRLTGLSFKEKLRWIIFKISPKIQKYLIQKLNL